jgi:hypothetical protein
MMSTQNLHAQKPEIHLSPETVRAVLAEILRHKDGCELDAGELEFEMNIGGYGLVASQVARATFALKPDWRDWIRRNLPLFADRSGVTTEQRTSHAFLLGMTNALLAGAFELGGADQDGRRDAVIEAIDNADQKGGDCVNTSAMWRIARAALWMAHDEAVLKDDPRDLGTSAHAASEMARGIAGELADKRGVAEAHAYVKRLESFECAEPSK